MPYVVHKHTIYLERPDTQTVWLPLDTELLCVREQREHLCLWYRCDPTVKALTQFKFDVVGTGQFDCPSQAKAKYLGTAMFCGGDLVLHVFYRKLD